MHLPHRFIFNLRQSLTELSQAALNSLCKSSKPWIFHPPILTFLGSWDYRSLSPGTATIQGLVLHTSKAAYSISERSTLLS